MPEARGPQAYISGKSRAPMLQASCITPGTLKIAQTYSWLLCLFISIAMGSRCDNGIFMTFIYTLHYVLVLIVGLELNMCNTFYSKTSA